MKVVRWNKRYLTGDSKLDNSNIALVALLTDLRDELSRKEHCQEINELTDRLSDLTKQKFSKLPGDPGVGAEIDAAIRNLLKSDFPLASLSTPACRKCGLCDLVADRIAEWLSEGSEKQRGSPHGGT